MFNKAFEYINSNKTANIIEIGIGCGNNFKFYKEKSFEKDDLSTIKQDTEIRKLSEIIEPELDGINEIHRTMREKTIHDFCFNERTGSKHPSQESKI